MAAAEMQGRIGEFPAIAGLPVHTSWDLGYGDATSVWFWQITPERRRLVGYLREQRRGDAALHRGDEPAGPRARLDLGRALAAARRLAHEWSTGRTRFEQFHEATKRWPRRVPNESVEDGINAARLDPGSLRVRCGGVLGGPAGARGYRKEWDEERGPATRTGRATIGRPWRRRVPILRLAVRDARPVVVKPKPPFEMLFDCYATRDGVMHSTSTIIEMLEKEARADGEGVALAGRCRDL